MMKYIGGLAACDVATHPVAVVGSSDIIYRGFATYQDALQGGGEIMMQDGSRRQFIFGRNALRF